MHVLHGMWGLDGVWGARFGVEQRAKLYGKASPTPHVLTMTATPIPRTLALVAHGDMALSALNQLPPGRIPTSTHVLRDGKGSRSKVHPASVPWHHCAL